MNINVEASTQKFRQKFYDLGFTMDQSQNKASNYRKCKEERDTLAVKDFLKSDTFKYIKTIK